MNQRAVAIAVVALFALCFVGSGAVVTLTFIKKISEAASAERESFTPPPIPSDPDGELLPPDEAGEPSADDYEAPVIGFGQFAVFHHEKLRQDPWKALQKAAKGSKVKVFKGEAPPSTVPPYVELRDLSVEDYAVITGDTLEQGRGLTDAVKKALPGTKRVSVFDAVMPLGVTHLQEVSKLLAAHAQATGGVLWDEEAQEYLSLEYWKARRVDSWEKGVPHAAMNFTVFVDDEGKGVALKSAGLRHFGLPELALGGIPRSSRDAAVSLLNATAQILAERAEPPGPGLVTVSLAGMKHAQQRANLEDKTFENAQKTVDVLLVPLAGEKVPTLTISLPGDGSASERVEAGIASLFGSEDHVDQVQHDEALTALSKQQLEVYKTTIKKRFRKGLQYGEVLLVKAPFETTSGGNEWMWVEVSKLGAGGRIEGLLANEPDEVPSLHSGSEVVVQEDQLFDWMFKEADGGTLGNETGKVMLKQLGR